MNTFFLVSIVANLLISIVAGAETGVSPLGQSQRDDFLKNAEWP